MARVEQGVDQFNKTKQLTSLEEYIAFDEIYFPDNRHWIDGLICQLDALNKLGHIPTPSYFSLLGAAASCAGQYGYTWQDGNLINYPYPDEVVLPRHQLALSCNSAYLALQANEHKQRVRDRIYNLEPDLADAAWGFFFKSERGKILHYGWTDRALIKEATDRLLLSSRPILIPDLGRLQKIADLKFLHNEAANMTTKTFRQEVLPKLEGALGDLFKVEEVFAWGDSTKSKE